MNKKKAENLGFYGDEGWPLREKAIRASEKAARRLAAGLADGSIEKYSVYDGYGREMVKYRKTNKQNK